MRALGPFALALTIVATTATASRDAAAEEVPARQPRSGLLPVVVGGVTALVPIGVGAASMAHVTSLGHKNVGFVFAGAGLVVAPLFAHGVVDEWDRGLWFCLPSLGAEAGMIALASARPDAVFEGTRLTRTFFVGLFTASVFLSAVGVGDAALVGDRAEGHGPFAHHAPRPFEITSIAPGAGDSPFGLTISLSL